MTFREQLLIALSEGPTTVTGVAKRLERRGVGGAVLRTQSALKRLEDQDMAHCYRDDKGRWVWERM